MTAKEYLSQIGKLEHAIECMKMRSKYYDQMSLSIPGPSYGEKIGSNPNRNLEAPFIKWLEKKDELDRKIVKKEEELVSLKAHVTIQIESFDSEEYKNVILMRYFRHMSWNDIARKLFCSNATVYRWHEAALALIKIPIKDDSQ